MAEKYFVLLPPESSLLDYKKRPPIHMVLSLCRVVFIFRCNVSSLSTCYMCAQKMLCGYKYTWDLLRVCRRGHGWRPGSHTSAPGRGAGPGRGTCSGPPPSPYSPSQSGTPHRCRTTTHLAHTADIEHTDILEHTLVVWLLCLSVGLYWLYLHSAFGIWDLGNLMYVCMYVCYTSGTYNII